MWYYINTLYYIYIKIKKTPLETTAKKTKKKVAKLSTLTAFEPKYSSTNTEADNTAARN
jgi:hypothetical protein